MELTGRSIELRNNISDYLNAQGLWRHNHLAEPKFTALIELDLASIELSVAGPHQPHQWFKLADTAKSFQENVEQTKEKEYYEPAFGEALTDGAIAIASITSCTNTANPRQMIQAALLARNARNHNLKPKPWLKTSLSPGSRVVADYLAEADLLDDFAALGFDIVGFGCMTCIGNSGALEPHMETFADQGLETVVVLSGNRNFQSRVNPKVQVGYLMSPALVVAYSLAGTINIDIEEEPLSKAGQGDSIYLSDIMPSDEEVEAILVQVIKPELFERRNESLWDGTHHWQALAAAGSIQFDWNPQSTYIRRPIYLETMAREPVDSLDINNAHVLLVLGDNITTDHISPASAIPLNSQAGQWLTEQGESASDLNQYSTRRSNHEVMMRGSFVNPSLQNQLLDSQPAEGGWATAIHGNVQRVYDAALSYVEQGLPLVIFAGWNYGAGSSRDWAAKSQATLGIKAVIAQSFERIHRSNLIGMGVFPIEFLQGESAELLNLKGDELFNIRGLDTLTLGNNTVYLEIVRSPAFTCIYKLNLTIDVQQELQYLKHGGILPSIVRDVL